ncbi:hypothetical protein SUGI_0715570 [Cryptomeria japonica]|uniref:probable xyloglucan endotransglucosylase/hydrolase protein 8 n=1 Tax=Cryptomeria japonica TaxID=3369 RepID=UPI002414CB45|nr:probable xyloglucan endotransglucosylase/hydrolase protein 8 [Cryptomeria japonica]GLJ35596.1 hypothetical protein SUGI_0715570 [Cryptomeria japonica]
MGLSGAMIPLGFALLLFGGVSATAQSAADQAFDDNFQITYAADHFKTSDDGQIWQLMLEKKIGSGFHSKQSYRFGWFSMKLKLAGGDAAGVVTTYYMASKNFLTRDELDFEFLGNTSGQPYILQTNIYVNGSGNREQRHMLWFDPTMDYHTYSVLWNNHQIVFFADLVPVRVYRNTGSNGFPNEQPMSICSSIWNADDWATQGGLVKTDWRKAPFISYYRKFKADGCMWKDPYPACVSTTTQNWWDQEDAWTLSDAQNLDYTWARRNFLVYDYCLDTKRFAQMPVECSISTMQS